MWLCLWLGLMALSFAMLIVMARSKAGIIAANVALVVLVAAITAFSGLVSFLRAILGGKSDTLDLIPIVCIVLGLALVIAANMLRSRLQD